MRNHIIHQYTKIENIICEVGSQRLIEYCLKCKNYNGDHDDHVDRRDLLLSLLSFIISSIVL
jgi:hypothetical protein